MTAGGNGRDILALQARVSDALAQLARTDAELVKVRGMLKALGSRVLALENPEKPLDRAHRGLREIQEKVEAADPGRVKGYEQEKWEARQKLKSTEKIGM